MRATTALGFFCLLAPLVSVSGLRISDNETEDAIYRAYIDDLGNEQQQIRNHGVIIKVPVGQACFTIRGSVVAFVCTPGSDRAITLVSVTTFINLLAYVAERCG
ncbi:hypothetical protein B0T26DRAFT_873061 [Lasiosphaeria miniovina]|uniref:Uncharacterized protein n=1 Tax=Lasiosphaeria miniovina TaxID=1954250 RepID=A0AA40DTD0_9PEZI|nr:uncharacterized protein B0T26DRAFT_873061 [Lasiosphaeria miniovina]KAK0712716.1 hypothetical protein B0T26DRAFT_873061 [Lasiosphaeria miniovina]